MKHGSVKGLQRFVFLLMTVCLGIASMGCRSALPPPTDKTCITLPPGPLPGTILGPGDKIEIKFPFAAQFNEEQVVRPDGKIALQLVGEVDVRGKTPEGLRQEITELYSKELKHPQAAVIVRSLFDQRVYVGGAVKEPGFIEIPGSLTALEAIMQAGGFLSETAAIQNVVVVRHEKDKRYGCMIDFRGAVAGQATFTFHLQPRDIVYVPETTIVKLGRWINQHLYGLLPPQLGFSATIYDAGANGGN